MTAANPERAASAPQAKRSAPVARISRSTLAANIAVATRERSEAEVRVADARADAWGHGASIVARSLRDAGVDAVRVEEDAFDLLRELGITGLTMTAEPNVNPLTVFGLPGGHPRSRPVMRLTGEVLSTKALLRGEGVSYGYTHRASVDTRVALVTGGYAQGIVRALGDRAWVTIGGVRHPIIGRVAMDVCVVDVRDADVARGAEAIFLGDPDAGEPSIGEWVSATGFAAAELATMVGQRCLREYVA